MGLKLKLFVQPLMLIDMRKDAQKIEELISVNLPIPTEEEISETIKLIEERLEDKRLNMFKNSNVKEGYTQALVVLKSRKLDYGNVESIQGRAIASIAYDYLCGDCSRNVLINVPVKSQF